METLSPWWKSKIFLCKTGSNPFLGLIRIHDISICFWEFSSICVGLITSVSGNSVLFEDLSTFHCANTLFLILFLVYSFLNFFRNCFCEKKLLLYFVLQGFIRAFFIIFIVFLFGVNGELIFTVEELRVSFFLNESHFRLSCCFSFLCNLSSLRLFVFLEASFLFGNCWDTIIGGRLLSVSTVAQLSFSSWIFSINAFFWARDRRTLSLTASLPFFNVFLLSWGVLT